MSSSLSVGLIGFGLAGASFHAPLIRAVPGLSLRKVFTSRIADAEMAGLSVVRSAEALFEDPAIDLIVIASPNQTHYPLAKAALLAGKHVVIDKPIAVTMADADELITLSRERRRILTVFHNRRWDGDFLTVRRLVDDGQLGEITLFEACWDRFRPAIKQGWREAPEPGSGLLNDLGPHMVDQALVLFGWPDAVSADMAVQRQDARVDDYFSLTLYYGEKRVRLAASTLIAQPRPRFALHGLRGSFIKYGLDPQEAQLRSGMSPTTDGFGVDRPERFGIIFSAEGASAPVPTLPGSYMSFYQGVADAIRTSGLPPVDPNDARAGLSLIDLARRSAEKGIRIPATPRE